MVKKKVDPRVRGLIEHSVRKNHRSFFVLVGDHGKDQVENIHKILTKTRVRARPSVLWCYKKELGFSTHRKKRMKEIKKSQARGTYDAERDDPFELFIASTDIRWTYYKETEKVLGQTFGMCVLQDFEAITPNLLARTIETVEGGGIVIILMKTVKSLKQLYTMSMDVHSRFRTEAHHEVVPRFNERFILSLGQCNGCLVLDDELNILPISSQVNHIPSYDDLKEGLEEGYADASGLQIDPELEQLKKSLLDTPHVGNLVNMTKTIDQAKAVMSFLDAISEKTLRSTVSLTAARGRGKSAAIGLCLAGAVSYGYSNIFVTAPSPENLKTVFEFLISGLKALKYAEHLDFEVIQEHLGEAGKVVTRVNIFRAHRQTVQYVQPSEHAKLSQAELVAIDEAAAIPLPTVKKLMGPYLTFMSSTINGYEGTGRSLSLKLLQQLRVAQAASTAAAANQAGASVAGAKSMKGERKIHEQRWKVAAEAAASYSGSGSQSNGARVLTELELSTPIRYSQNDPVEKWLNNLLCMDVASNSVRLLSVMPAPKDCELYVVDRDALFSYHSLAESLLQRVWALYTAAHYKNSPNDLQMLSDAPAHRLFVLLGPQSGKTTDKHGKPILPDVLCVVQVAYEGMISRKSVQSELNKANKASGDMIPWTVAQQFNDSAFATLSGVRIVRIATHPDVQKMGYGSRAIDLLCAYYQGQLTIDTILPSTGVFGGESSAAVAKSGNHAGKDLFDEEVQPRSTLPPLLTNLADRPAERLHWIGVGFGLTAPLLGFWSRKGFKACYLRQTPNPLTGEFTCIALKELDCSNVPEAPQAGWLNSFTLDYRNRLIQLLSYSFSSLESGLALTLIDPEKKLTAASESLVESLETAQGVIDSSNSAEIGTIAYRNKPVDATELLSVHFTHHDMKRLEMYSRNMVDHHMIMDTLPTLAKLLFQGRMPSIRLSNLQVAILLSTGLQHRDVDSIAAEMDLPANQVLAFFNKTIRKISSHLRTLVETHTVANELPSSASVRMMEKRLSTMDSLGESLKEDQASDVRDFEKVQRELLMGSKDLSRHAIKGGEGVEKKLQEALDRGIKHQNKAIPTSISIAKEVDNSQIIATDNGEAAKVDVHGSGKKDKKSKRKSHGEESMNTKKSKKNRD